MANIIQQFKDASGNNIFPLAYAQGGMKIDLLWTNPSPTSAFAAQTVSLGLSEYEWLLINSRRSDGYDQYVTYLIPVNGLTQIMSCGQLNVNPTASMMRGVTATSIGCTFTTGYASGNSSSNTGWLIPYKIYGIKMSYIVPTSVHGLQYVEV